MMALLVSHGKLVMCYRLLFLLRVLLYSSYLIPPPPASSSAAYPAMPLLLPMLKLPIDCCRVDGVIPGCFCTKTADSGSQMQQLSPLSLKLPPPSSCCFGVEAAEETRNLWYSAMKSSCFLDSTAVRQRSSRACSSKTISTRCGVWHVWHNETNGGGRYSRHYRHLWLWGICHSDH